MRKLTTFGLGLKSGPRSNLPTTLHLTKYNSTLCRSQWPCGRRHGSAASRLLGLWVRIPPAAQKPVFSECCELSVILRRADHSSRGVLPSVVCPVSVIAKPRSGRPWFGIGPKRHSKKKIPSLKISPVVVASLNNKHTYSQSWWHGVAFVNYFRDSSGGFFFFFFSRGCGLRCRESGLKCATTVSFIIHKHLIRSNLPPHKPRHRIRCSAVVLWPSCCAAELERHFGVPP